jgi:hypothetical protein
MTNAHTPRLRTSLLAALIGSAVNISAGYAPADWKWWQVVLLFVTGAFCYVLAITEVCLVVSADKQELKRLDTERVQAISQCPADRLNALGYVVPELGLRVINSQPVPMWEGVIELDTFRKFLTACRDDYIAPVREWGKSAEDQNAYELILEKLMELGYVYSKAEGGEPRGPRSWLFRPNALKRLWSEWMGFDVVFQGIQEL